MQEYLKAQMKTNEIILNNSIYPNELHRFSVSDYRWADIKTKPFYNRPIKQGEIYQFEFGKNYTPEMSYEHRGLIIGSKQKLLYVLPICSYDPSKHPSVFHPIDYPNSKSDLFLLKNSDFSFIQHDSILKLNDIRTVSTKRILYQHDGRIPPESETYKLIESLVLQKYFPSFYYHFLQSIESLDKVTEQLVKMQTLLETQKMEIEQQRNEIQSLKKNYKSVIKASKKISKGH